MKPAEGRWQHALESRRVLALLLVAPAVIFMALVVGVPFVWAIYLSFTDAIGGSLTGHWVGFDNFANAWHDDNFRRALRNTLIFTLASQAIVVVGAAVLSNFLVRDFRGKWFMRFLVVLPWAAPVVLSTIAWLWLLDSLYSVLNWTLADSARQRPRLVAGRGAHRGGRAGAAAVAGPPEPRARRDHDRARMADPPIRGRDLHRRAARRSRPRSRTPRRSTARPGLKKLWYVDLPLQLPIALIAVLFGIVFTAADFAVVYILTHGGPFNSTQVLPTWAYAVGIDSGSLGEARRSRCSSSRSSSSSASAMLFFARRAQVS